MMEFPLRFLVVVPAILSWPVANMVLSHLVEQHPTLRAAHDRSWVTATSMTVVVDIFFRKPLSVLARSVFFTIRGMSHTPSKIAI